MKNMRFIGYLLKFACLLVTICVSLTNAYAQEHAPDVLSQLRITPRFSKKYPREMQNRDRNDKHIYLLSVDLGHLSANQFNELKAYFKNQISISYDRQRDYHLEDFLPPVMQALLNKSIKEMDLHSLEYPKDPWYPTLIGLKEGFATATNCIGTAFEVSRVIGTQNGVGRYYLYSPGRTDASEKLSDPSVAKSISENELQFGDLFFAGVSAADDEASDTPSVQHMAIFLTKNIYFEKRDSGNIDPYRLVLLEDMQSRLKKALIEQNWKTKFLRLNPSQLTQLVPEDNGRSYLKSLEENMDPHGRNEIEEVFANASTQIKNSIWSAGADESRMGGGIETIFSFIEPISVRQDFSGKASMTGAPETLKRFSSY